MGAARELIDRIKSKEGRVSVHREVLTLAQRNREELLPFVILCLRECDEENHFHLRSAIDLLTELELEEVAQAAMQPERLTSEGSEELLELIALHYPGIMISYAEELLDLDIDLEYPWRAGGEREIAYLIRVIENGDEKKARRAWNALIAMRRPESIVIAEGYAERFCNGQWDPKFSQHLAEVGYEIAHGMLRKLTLDDVYHINFADDYFGNERKLWTPDFDQPNWKLKDIAHSDVPFGGSLETACGLCTGSLHRVIELPGAVIGEKTPITIATCLSCLGWEIEPLFYRHDINGVPAPVQSNPEKIEPQVPAHPLKATKAKIAKTPQRWTLQGSISEGNMNRIGGEPTWVQSEVYYACPGCEKTMTYIMQLDTLPNEKGSEHDWGSGGICYIFWCAKCRTSALTWQCT